MSRTVHMAEKCRSYDHAVGEFRDGVRSLCAYGRVHSVRTFDENKITCRVCLRELADRRKWKTLRRAKYMEPGQERTTYIVDARENRSLTFAQIGSEL